MALLDDGGLPLQRGDVIKSRQRIHFKTWKGKVVAQAWPKKRGRPKSQRQLEWVKRFALLACLNKNTYGPGIDFANEWASGTGWLPRDVFTSAAYGRFIMEGHEIKVTTPTANVARSTNQALTADVTTKVTFTTVTWDNNVFFATAAPTRLTFKAPGLYIFGSYANFAQNASAGYRVLRPLKNNASPYPGQRVSAAANMPIPQLSQIWVDYFHENDYLELTVISQQSLNLAAAGLWCVAITPEGIIA